MTFILEMINIKMTICEINFISTPKNMGNQALWDRLDQIDPVAAAKIPVTNERRVIRALEVFEKDR